MLTVPSLHAFGAILVATAMFVAFARGRLPVELVSLGTIVLIALWLYVMPLPGQRKEEGWRSLSRASGTTRWSRSAR